MILDVADDLVEARNLAGASEIQEMLRLSRQRVSQLMRLEDFPQPFRTLRMGSIYRRDEVRRWAKDRGYRLFDSDGQAEPDQEEGEPTATGAR